MTNQYMQEEDDAILKTYNRYPVVLDHGDGAYLYDPEGKKYLDFSAGYAVSSLGYNNKEFNDALKAQIDKMIHTSNLYYNTTCGKAGEDLKKITGMYKVFFTNSGGEAIEGAIKTARKYAYTKKTGRYEFIAMENSFHGRSMGAVALTGHKEYREPFEPVMPGVHFAIYNDLDSVKALVNDKTCAIILETVQGEGGIIVPPAGYLREVKEICEKKGALLIADEVQTGIGRTGEWFGVNHDGVTPDLMACAKALGGGVMPIGAIIGTPRAWAGLIEAPFLHTSTFGGNQLACAAGVAAIKAIKEEDMLRRGRETGAYLKAGLEAIAAEYPSVIKEVRGRGMMIGIELTKEGAGGMLMSLMINQHIIVAYTLNNPKDIRMEPPLIMPKEVIDHVLEAFRGAVKETADVIEDL